MCTYFFFKGLPRIINEINDWGSTILKACVVATENVLNEVILNESIGGVLYEKKLNYTLFVEYLRGETSQLSLPDTNNNTNF